MILHPFIRRAAALLLAAPLAACVQPPAPATHIEATAAAPAPAAPAPPSEHLDLPLHEDGLDWKSAGGGPLQSGGDMQEYVPEGETVADWTQMVTVLTLPPNQDPSARLAAILSGLRAACKSYRVIQSTVSQDNHTANLLARCDQPDETAFNDANILLLKHEVIWAKTIEGRADNYVVWRAWHGDAIAPNSVLASRTVRQAWQDWVDEVAVVQGGA